MRRVNAKLNKFNLTHSHGTTADMGWLFPVASIFTMPGDIFRISNEFLVEFLALIAPPRHVYTVSLHWWYAPLRIVWKDFPDFLTGGPKGDNASVWPYIMAPEGGFKPGSLANRLRCPVNGSNYKVSALPFRIYNMIWNEFYRSEVLQDPVDVSLESGEDTVTNVELLRRGWQHDYFTDGAPSVSKGPQVTLPLGTTAPVVGDGNVVTMSTSKGQSNLSLVTKDGYDNKTFVGLQGVRGPNFGEYGVTFGDSSGLVADLSHASAVTINSLRYASAVWQFQELNMENGNRYAEFIPSHYGVFCPDASLQRPQYLGGSTAPVTVGKVLQTSASTADSPQGNMAGTASSAGMSPEIRFMAREHGYLMCLMSIRPETTYFQGVPRDLSYETRYDLPLPLFAHLGQQEIKNKEIYVQGNEDDDKPFAYTNRYDECRSIPNIITGQLVSTLDYWTSARKFAELPKLNGEFIEARPDDRIFAVKDTVENSDHLVVQVLHHISALRPLPKRGTPGMKVI
uniref:Major capsid protein n=1 Tax=uncultured Elusimicrobia bacterium TaxID=699876 RepID=A0A650EM52_9BACT|nr:hypothetical protein Elusimicrob1349_1930 [uncultured Elusimicrobia bacterium]